MSTVRFALIGCGRVAASHGESLAQLPQASLVAVCDLIPERARAFSQQYGVPMYTNYHAMLLNEKVDVVSILTPSGMHPTHAIDVMSHYGKHVVVEKPMALAWSDLLRMKSVADECGVKVFPVYQNRYNKAVQKVRRDLLTGALGKLALATARVRWCRTQQYYDNDPWRGTWAMDGGALTNQGIHYIDLLQYLVGDVVSVTAHTATQLVNIEVEDTAVATLRFKNGALGVIEVTTAARPDDSKASISILAEKGMVVLTGIACNQLSVYTLEPAATLSYSEEFPNAYGFGHRPFLQEVIVDLLGGRPHSVPFQEGARAIRLLNALYRSAEDNREVHLDKGEISGNLGRPDPRLAALYETPLPATPQ